MNVRALIVAFACCALYIFCASVLSKESTQTVKIPTRDGRFLMADVILPSTEGTYPCIYIHTPYRRESAAAPLPDSPFKKELLDRDHYAYVISDWRGFFGSKEAGEGVKRPPHGEDGYDAIKWIAKQPWSNGKVGMWGHSAPGAIQFRVADTRPPHLICAVPASACPGGSYQQYYYGGVPQKAYLAGLAGVGHDRFGGVTLGKQHPYRDWLWQYAERSMDPKNIDIPMLFITAWNDEHVELKIDTFSRLQSRSKNHASDMKLLIGPWHHTAFGMAKQGALEFPQAAGAPGDTTLKFFDYFLRDKKDSGWASQPPVRFFIMGSNKWSESKDWPPATANRDFYIHEGGKLTQETPQGEPADKVSFNRDDPSPTIGGSNLETKHFKSQAVQKIGLDAGALDQKEVEKRSDVLIYSSDVLDRDLTVVGSPAATIYVSSSRSDTDVAARITDVYPDGRSMLVTDGIQRVSLRNSLAKPEFVKPHTPTRVSVKFVPTAQTFLKGHRIRLILSATNYPRFDLNDADKAMTGTDTIYHDCNRPSCLSLPILP